MSVFGTRLRLLRRAKDMSQEELAGLVETSKQVISRYEIGMRIPKITVASRFAQILEVPVDYLLGNTDDPSFPSREQLLLADSFDEIAQIAQAARRMTPDERQRMLILVRAAFNNAFE